MSSATMATHTASNMLSGTLRLRGRRRGRKCKRYAIVAQLAAPHRAHAVAASRRHATLKRQWNVHQQNGAMHPSKVSSKLCGCDVRGLRCIASRHDGWRDAARFFAQEKPWRYVFTCFGFDNVSRVVVWSNKHPSPRFAQIAKSFGVVLHGKLGFKRNNDNGVIRINGVSGGTPCPRLLQRGNVMTVGRHNVGCCGRSRHGADCLQCVRAGAVAVTERRQITLNPDCRRCAGRHGNGPPGVLHHVG